MSPANSEIAYLLSLHAVRDRAQLVFEAAQKGSLVNFDYNAERLPAVADFVNEIISRDYGPDKFSTIPPHGRWQHFDVGGIARIDALLEKWLSNGCDKIECTRRLIDLFFVSVLLDAGAGDTWKFTEPGTGRTYNRSEGIAVASLYMFTAGVFSSDKNTDEIVDAHKLIDLTDAVFGEYFQITPENPLVGVSTRVALLNSVGRSLLRVPEIIGPAARPGNMVDYLLKTSKEPNELNYESLWSTLQSILIPSWPSNRTRVVGHPIGDAWPLRILEREAGDSISDGIQPFHKLTQWLGYSLTVPFTRILGFKIANDHLGTGLPEYRNGGLFVDLGILQLKPELLELGRRASGQVLPKFSATSDTVVEWRAMTVALLDKLFVLVSARFAEQGITLNMAQMLEAGTWKGGREIAAKLRPATKSSPILIDGDGTLF